MLNLKDIAFGVAKLKAANDSIMSHNHFGLELISEEFIALPENSVKPYSLQTSWYVHNAHGRSLLAEHCKRDDFSTDYPYIINATSFVDGSIATLHSPIADDLIAYKKFFDAKYALPAEIEPIDILTQLPVLLAFEEMPKVGAYLVCKDIRTDELVRSAWPVDAVVKVTGKKVCVARTEDGMEYLVIDKVKE